MISGNGQEELLETLGLGCDLAHLKAVTQKKDIEPGRIRLPEGTRVDVPPFADGDTMITVVEDTAGAIMVKRYRLVLPGEE